MQKTANQPTNKHTVRAMLVAIDHMVLHETAILHTVSRKREHIIHTSTLHTCNSRCPRWVNVPTCWSAASWVLTNSMISRPIRGCSDYPSTSDSGSSWLIETAKIAEKMVNPFPPTTSSNRIWSSWFMNVHKLIVLVTYSIMMKNMLIEVAKRLLPWSFETTSMQTQMLLRPAFHSVRFYSPCLAAQWLTMRFSGAYPPLNGSNNGFTAKGKPLRPGDPPTVTQRLLAWL